MLRRDFLGAAPAALLAGGLALAGDDELGRHRIARVTGFKLACPRNKVAGKNARLDVHGDRTGEDLLIIATDRGLEGVGLGTSNREAARALIGRRLDAIWKPGVGMESPLGRADHALYDLVGKALGVPAWSMLGGEGAEQVDVYDGSLYFNDLLPEFVPWGAARVAEEARASFEAGHRAFKIKVGRGHKWMEPEAGFRRDVEVVRAVRQAVGPDCRLMVDANNGWTPESTRRWLDEVGVEQYFVEEPFPEEVGADRDLKAYFKSKGWTTLLADGESARDAEHFDPYLEADALDVIQPDIRAFGLSLLARLARRAAARPGVKLATHNWGSHLGLYMQATLARGVPNFLMAEQDPSACDLIDSSAFAFAEGKLRVPDVPGCGLVLRRDVFDADHRASSWTEAAG